MSKLYTGAEIVFKCMEDQKVEFIFGYPGGAVLPIYDELKNHSSIKHILVRHEQGAGHALPALHVEEPRAVERGAPVGARVQRRPEIYRGAHPGEQLGHGDGLRGRCERE